MELDKPLLHAEIERRLRRRFLGVYLSLALAALMLAGHGYSTRLLHGAGWSSASATIVAIGTDPGDGEAMMTSEFHDAAGTLHRDTQPAGYHYARGEPRVGQGVGYLYKTSGLTGDFQAVPRADGLLKWIFGVPALILLAAAVLVAWLALRQRELRRWLLEHGRREPGQTPAIRCKTVVVPRPGAMTLAMRMWRVEARYFDPARSGFVSCHSDWVHGAAPDLRVDGPLPTILIDPAKSSRYWLSVGSLGRTGPG